MIRAWRLLVAGGLVPLCLTAAACSRTPDSVTAPHGRCTAVFAAPYEHIHACSAEAVMAAAVTAVFTYRPADQDDPRAAFRQGEPLMDPGFARRAEPAAPVLAPVTAVMWQQWAIQQVTVTASSHVTQDDRPPDTPTSAARVLAVTLRPGDHGRAIEFTVYAHASRATSVAGWRITALEVQT